MQLSADRLLVHGPAQRLRGRARPSSSPASATRRWPSACSCSSPTWARCDIQDSCCRRGAALAGRVRRWRSPRRRCCWAAPWASRRSCRCRPGCPTRWPAPRRSARSSTRRPWSRPASTSSRARTCSSRWRRPCSSLVAIIGALTLLLAGFSALVRHDIKRVLAYSTISQIGYMFLALGVGAWSAAIFHFMTHAFFKALLFLAAGVVIQALHDEHDIFRMGGLRSELPLAFWTFLIGAASLAALPLVTAGFYSKDLIIRARSTPRPGQRLASGRRACRGAAHLPLHFPPGFLVFRRAHGAPGAPAPAARMGMPLVVLALLSVVGGLVDVPPYLAGTLPALPGFLEEAAHARSRGSTRLSREGFLESLAGLCLWAASYCCVALRGGWAQLCEKLAASARGPALHACGCRLGLRLALRPALRAAVTLACAGEP